MAGSSLILPSDISIRSQDAILSYKIPDPYWQTTLVDAAVEFQFPPKVTSDSRRGSWNEKDVMGSEPIAIYAGSSPRNISLAITYILDGEWDCERIKRNVRLMRGYFARSAGTFIHQESMAVRLKLWCIGGNDFLTFRCRSCDVKYSETMVRIESAIPDNTRFQLTPVSQFVPGVNPEGYFPLRTDVTLDLASWTTNISLTKPQDPDKKEPVQNIIGLSERMTEDWF